LGSIWRKVTAYVYGHYYLVPLRYTTAFQESTWYYADIQGENTTAPQSLQ